MNSIDKATLQCYNVVKEGMEVIVNPNPGRVVPVEEERTYTVYIEAKGLTFEEIRGKRRHAIYGGLYVSTAGFDTYEEASEELHRRQLQGLSGMIQRNNLRETTGGR